MRPSKDLRRLQRSSLARVKLLRTYTSAELAGTPARRLDPAIAFVVIELDNLWAGVARSLFLSTAFGARDGSGHRLTLSRVTLARTVDDALTHAMRRCRKARYKPGSSGPWTWNDEPRWWDRHVLLDALDELGASNAQRVGAALSASPGVFAHLHAFRTFYAHRDEGTHSRLGPALQKLGFPTKHTASEALTSPAPAGARPQPLILDWLDDMRDTIELLV